MQRILTALAVTIILLAAAFGPARAEGEPRLTVGVPALNVRLGPGTNYAVIAALRQGDDGPITGQNAAGWYQVTLADGRSGWVSGSYVQLSGDVSGVPQVAAPSAAAADATTGSSATGISAAPGGTGTTAGAASGPSAGGTIVFQVSSGGAIYALNPDGSNLRLLTHGMDPALSPDGLQVAFTRWDGVQNGISGSLWVINVDGSGERQVMAGALQPKSPTWSADGRQLVVSMQQGGPLGGRWLCTVDGKRTPVGAPIAGQRCMPERADPHWALRSVNVSSGAYKDLQDETHSFAPTWDPANAWRVIFRGDKGLESLDLNRETLTVLSANGAYRGPSFSPDGTRLAVTFKQNDHWEVHVLNADGSGEVRLTETPMAVILAEHLQGRDGHAWNNAAPAWSPDGSQIAFISDRNGAYDLFVMNADGSNQHLLLAAEALGGQKIQYDGVDERVITWR